MIALLLPILPKHKLKSRIGLLSARHDVTYITSFFQFNFINYFYHRGQQATLRLRITILHLQDMGFEPMRIAPSRP